MTRNETSTDTAPQTTGKTRNLTFGPCPAPVAVAPLLLLLLL
jgi:hypothetical protein